MSRIGAHELLRQVLDPGSWVSWNTQPVEPAAVSPSYADQLARARDRTGLDESVVTGAGSIRGRRVVVLACEFDFLAGSIGVGAAERLVHAIERATAEGLPLVASPTSGGTRMQEGTVAFLQMVKISAAVTRHKAAGLPYLVYLRHPTTGGVFASWGSLGQVTAAEPGAMIGFLGPRVYEALYGDTFPEGIQVAENLFDHGLLDAVIAAAELPEIAARALNVLCAPQEGPADVADMAQEPITEVPAWESIQRSRRRDRPGVREMLRLAARDVTPLHGTGEGEGEPALRLALARFGRAPCILLGQDRTRQAKGQQLGPAGLRKARRGMQLARELRLPLVTIIDTAGAALSSQAEQGGLAGEIARCVSELVTLETVH